MIKKSNYILILIFLTISSSLFSQSDSLEIFIIDAYVTPESPHIFKLSFFTSEEVKSKINIDEKYLTNISDDFVEDHLAEIDFTKYKFDKKFVPYKIISERGNGEIIESEIFELILPYEEFIETKEGGNPVSTILFGMLLYLIPSPNMILTNNDNYFSLTKEFPIITFYSSGYNYPSGNISLEYTHIYESTSNNILRLGYKYTIPIRLIDYITPGVTGFTDFCGFNGIGAEVSFGLFKVYDIFTVYTRYRYNFKPSNANQFFHEISIGLFSHFFTIDI